MVLLITDIGICCRNHSKLIPFLHVVERFQSHPFHHVALQGKPAPTRSPSARNLPPAAGSAALRLQASLAEPAALDNQPRPASSARDSFSAAPAPGALPAHSARDSFLVNAPAPIGNDFQQWAARKTRAMLEAAPAPDPALLPKRCFVRFSRALQGLLCPHQNHDALQEAGHIHAHRLLNARATTALPP